MTKKLKVLAPSKIIFSREHVVVYGKPTILGFLDTAVQGVPDLFPDLTPQSLLKPIQNFINYERRLGK